jgi:hypothetical protein
MHFFLCTHRQTHTHKCGGKKKAMVSNTRCAETDMQTGETTPSAKGVRKET